MYEALRSGDENSLNSSEVKNDDDDADDAEIGVDWLRVGFTELPLMEI